MAARVVTITSGKGGVGKTTGVANLGVGLALEGKRVIVVDEENTKLTLSRSAGHLRLIADIPIQGRRRRA